MKKAIQANIRDRIFYIDEDAYALLQNYLHQLSAAFADDEGQEIVSDIETRISELFDERCSQGYNVIDISYVNQVIDTVGRPEQLSDNDYVAGNSSSDAEGSADSEGSTPPLFANDYAETSTKKKKLYRDVDNKVLGGVLSGLAKYLDWDVNVMRFLTVIIVIFSMVVPWIAVWPWLLIYLTCWMVIPPANTPRRKLEMEGQEVTVENIGNNVRGVNDQARYKSGTSLADTLGSIVTIFCKLALAVFGIWAVFIGICLAIGFLFFLFVLIGLGMFGVDQMATAFSTDFGPVVVWQCVLMLLLIFGGLLLLTSIVWAICSVLFNWKRPKTSTWISLLIIIILLAGAASLLAFKLYGMGYTPFPFD